VERRVRGAQVPQTDDATSDFLAKAEWSKDSFLVKQMADAIDADPHARQMSPLEQVKWADQKVREYFPHKFQPQQQVQQSAPQRNRVEGGGLASSPHRRSKGADDLPPEAMKEGREWVKEGVFKSLDDFAKSYWTQEV
jgi:hypothetical protein